MLKITKNNVSFTTSADYKLVVAIKLIDGSSYRLIQNIDGSAASFAQCVNKLTTMTNDDYKLFSSIQASAMSEGEEC